MAAMPIPLFFYYFHCKNEFYIIENLSFSVSSVFVILTINVWDWQVFLIRYTCVCMIMSWIILYIVFWNIQSLSSTSCGQFHSSKFLVDSLECFCESLDWNIHLLIGHTMTSFLLSTGWLSLTASFLGQGFKVSILPVDYVTRAPPCTTVAL